MAVDEDRKQIGLTPASQRTVVLLEKDLGWFSEGQEVGRFALGYAIRAGIEPGVTTGVETRWSPDLFDPTGEIRTVLKAMHPDTPTPVRLMEHFVNEGLRLIAAQIEAGDKSPTALMASPIQPPR